MEYTSAALVDALLCGGGKALATFSCLVLMIFTHHQRVSYNKMQASTICTVCFWAIYGNVTTVLPSVHTALFLGP